VIAGAYYARIVGSWLTLPSDNLFAYAVNPVPTSTGQDTTFAIAVANALANHWPTFAFSVMSSDYEATEATCYPLGSPLVPAQAASMVAPGSAGAPLTSGSTAILVNHATIRRGRGSQSRSYLSPVPNIYVSPDGLTIPSADLAAIQTHWNNFEAAVLTDLNAIDPLYTWRRVQVSKIPPGAVFNIVASNVEPKLSTQRRRTRRNG
jgi:hypothetical protein